MLDNAALLDAPGALYMGVWSSICRQMSAIQQHTGKPSQAPPIFDVAQTYGSSGLPSVSSMLAHDVQQLSQALSAIVSADMATV